MIYIFPWFITLYILTDHIVKEAMGCVSSFEKARIVNSSQERRAENPFNPISESSYPSNIEPQQQNGLQHEYHAKIYKKKSSIKTNLDNLPVDHETSFTMGNESTSSANTGNHSYGSRNANQPVVTNYKQNQNQGSRNNGGYGNRVNFQADKENQGDGVTGNYGNCQQFGTNTQYNKVPLYDRQQPLPTIYQMSQQMIDSLVLKSSTRSNLNGSQMSRNYPHSSKSIKNKQQALRPL